ncbi:response regulator transcription factor [Chitinophaga sp. S165]|uniref:response regulator transcription factor n=1 Tax=Chitinophaga sp. S165 TaxID=2135462 RepID=UPI000D711D37|nr:response regulator transcription factor [Chitinophaga sp. S165]PWV49610.1 LuxR family two component transcriptional regulator [Chitinophaga sp. S165]
MPDNKITLAIVDDHPIVQEGLQKLLAGATNITITGCFTTGADFIDFLKKHPLNIVLLDISLPDVNGIDLCREIKKLSPATSVLALSNHNERSIIFQMLQNGATGYLLKNISGEELITCINETMKGEFAFSNAVKEILARPSANELREIPKLTKREKEILLLIADGMTTSDIAGALHLSPLTVETHRKSLLQKFEVKNVAAMIKIATEQRLI